MAIIHLITGLGAIGIELYPDRAPRSVAAFLEQVDAGAYHGGSFARIVRADNDRGTPLIEVIQATCAPSVEIRFDIEHETTKATGLVHEDGTLSLGRRDGGKASAQVFFISLGRQPALDMGGGRAKDGLGFAVFGRVIAGMDVVRAIHAIETVEEAPAEYWRGQIAARPVPIDRIETDALRRATHNLLFHPKPGRVP